MVQKLFTLGNNSILTTWTNFKFNILYYFSYVAAMGYLDW